MAGYRIIFALLLAALWVPATSHALLEANGFIHHPSSATESDSDHDHDAADGFCAAANAAAPLVKGEAFPTVLYTAAFGTVDAPAIPTGAHGVSLSGLGTSPPWLAKGWQFVFRAALPGRAPSISS